MIKLSFISKLGLLSILLLCGSYLSCRKPHLSNESRNMQTMSGELVLNNHFSMDEILEKLPQTVLYNLGDDVVFYTNETKVWNDKGNPAIYFPINAAKTKFLYATRNNEGKTEVHIRLIYNQSGDYSSGSYHSTEEILNLQTYEIHTQKFENNKLSGIKAPFNIASPNWESCMLDNGVFEIGDDGTIGANDEKLVTLGYPPCGWVGNGSSGNIFGRFGNWLRGVFSSSKEPVDYNSGNSGGNVFPPTGSGNDGWYPPGETGGSPGGGTGSMYGNDPRFNQPLTAPGFNNNQHGANGTWYEIGLNNPNDPTFLNHYADANGYISTNKTALKIYLQNNPYGAIDCNDIENLNMQHFQDLATFEPPNFVMQRIQNMINANSPVYSTNNTYIQKITDGVGVVNMDIFAVRIMEFPLKPNGIPMSPLEFLDFFRKNKSNSSLPIDGGTTFTPMQHFAAGSININETAIYNADYQNSLGAWVSIHIPLPVPSPIPLRNDGTVVLSDYHIDHSNQKYWYTFTTMATVYDGTHPVCGNRRFGIHPHTDGGWQFYITAVDRVWDLHVFLMGMNESAFHSADNVWSSTVNSVINYCNANGGLAQNLNTPHIKARITWDSVKQFLKGEINLQTLKDQLGCP